jgi:hypothetical protein
MKYKLKNISESQMNNQKRNANGNGKINVYNDNENTTISGS